MQPLGSRLKDQLGKPLTVGILSGLGAKALGVTYDVNLPVLGQVSGVTFYGIMGAASSSVSEVLKNWISFGRN